MIDPATPTRLRRDARLSRRNGGILASPPLLDTAADEIDQLRQAVMNLVSFNATTQAAPSWDALPPDWDTLHKQAFDDAAVLIGFDPRSPEPEADHAE